MMLVRREWLATRLTCGRGTGLGWHSASSDSARCGHDNPATARRVAGRRSIALTSAPQVDGPIGLVDDTGGGAG